MCLKIEKRNQKKTNIFFLVSELSEIQKRGKMFEFLREIEHPRNKLFDRIDALYVPPVEYDEIKAALENDRIVVISGPAEYGKTYTAIRLMWEYFNNGYKPKWIVGGGPWEREKGRKKLEDIERELEPKHIIYFEDPFGKVKYERREYLEREIGTIIDCVKRVDDAYVIITSREEVFKKFEREHIPTKALKDFEQRLNLKRPSYDYEKRKQILINWAESKGCKWLKNVTLRKVVLTSLTDSSNLPTPLSIRDFVISTVTISCADELKVMMKEKSRSVAWSFAREIKEMTDDKILFLLFVFISNFYILFVKAEYERLIGQIKLRTEDPWDFERVFNWFIDDKVTNSSERIVFSHPSYSEALKYLLFENGQQTRTNRDIFSPLMLKLYESEEARDAVLRCIVANFDVLSDDLKELLVVLADEKVEKLIETITGVNAVPQSLMDLLLRLAENEKTAGDLARAVAIWVGLLPADVRNRLLLKLSEKNCAAWAVAWAIIDRFQVFPKDLRNLLFELAERDETTTDVSSILVDFFHYLPRAFRSKLLLKLSEKKSAAWDVAWIVATNYSSFPKDLRNELIRNSKEKDSKAWPSARRIAMRF